MGWSEPNNHQTDIQIYFEIMNEDTSHQKTISKDDETDTACDSTLNGYYTTGLRT